jgi:two-component system sensor histidine kinase/response regulator
MRIRVANALITAVVLGFTAATSFSFHRYGLVRERESDVYRRQVEATREVARFLAGSKQLTSAVQSYAATADRQFAQAYWRELEVNRSRDQAAAALQRLGLSPQETELIGAARSSSDALVSQERQALAAAARGDRATAITLAFGPGYQQALRTIYEPSQRMQQLLEGRLAAERRQVGRDSRQLWRLSLGLLLLNLALVLAVLVWLYPRFVALPLLRLNGRVQALLRGERPEPLALGHAATEIRELAASMEAYRELGDQLVLDRWVKAEQVRITAELQRHASVQAQADCFLQALAPLLELGSATFYGLNPGSLQLELWSAYALHAPDAVPKQVALGEGLVGQCAVERLPISVEMPPPGYLSIGSGLGHCPPALVLVLPVVAGDRLLAVVELASLHPLAPHQLQLVNDLLPLLALVLGASSRPAPACTP